VSRTLALCYHALSASWPADLSVVPSAFEQQLRMLARAGYRGVTFSEAVLEPSSAKRVAITFDDAFESVDTFAKPVLDDLGWPATIYAVTDYADAARPLAWQGVGQWASTPHGPELASLGWEHLRELADAGWEIGSHTVTHPFLTRTSDEDLAHELTQSRLRVEAALERPCPSVAYPYGDFDERVGRAAAAAGYTTAGLLPSRWPRPSPLAYPRAGIYHRDTLTMFRAKTSHTVQAVRRQLRL
jgi:peptidoglycan/xylan/chitin deacetylase (PgdA/CDA1 family)